MVSAECGSFESMLRSSPQVNYDLKVDPLKIAKEMRASFSIDKVVPRPAGCQFKKQMYEYDRQTAEAYWIDYRTGTKNWDADRIILYFHGGGYIVGDFQTCRFIHIFLYVAAEKEFPLSVSTYSGFECHRSHIFNATIIHLEYCCAPEHPFPAAIYDALTLYRAIFQDGISPSRLAIMGDSAGGGLTLLAIQSLLARQLSKPRVTITLSAWTDFSLSGESFTRNRPQNVILHAEEFPWMVEQVLGLNHSQILRDDPSHNPLFGSFKDFPPLYIIVGTADILEDDSKRVANKAQREGIDVTLDVGEHLLHVYPLFFRYFPEARSGLDSIRQWLEIKFQ
ncbi:unnamed protein product [Rotaria sp. Silwood2]|nr:unnamed protein product [Rotaria sp. Silwood2]CAF4667289.1 unnamed protein product [Rotaria sp. Silwood2]